MFKLINFFDMPHLNQLRYEMGAPLAKNFKSRMEITLLDEESIRKLGMEGIDVSNLNEVKPQKDKTLAYRGQRILVYIRDVNNYRDPKQINLPKFHISYCKTLEKMRNDGRWQRYVIANRDDGYFNVKINNIDKSEKLDVCQPCLENLGWKDFSIYSMAVHEKQKIVRQFSLPDFFAKFPKSLFSVTPTYTSDTAPINDYSDNWPEISEKIRQERNYTCDNPLCRLQLVHDKKSLHVHHINGLKNDNSNSNLIVLCIRCHANQPGHSHMKGKMYEEFIEKYGNI